MVKLISENRESRRIKAASFDDMINQIENLWGYDCFPWYSDVRDEIPKDGFITIYDVNGNEYEAEFYKYSDGRYEIYAHNIHQTGNNINDSYVESVSRKNLKEDFTAKDVYNFLEETGGYSDYDQKIEDVMEEFGLSKEAAESYVWDYCSGLYNLGNEPDDELAEILESESVASAAQYYFDKGYDSNKDADTIEQELLDRGCNIEFIYDVIDELDFLQEEASEE